MQLYWEIGTYSHSEIELYMHYMRGSRNFHQGGWGGGPDQSDKKRSDNVFFCFFTHQHILLKSNGSFQRKLSCFKVPEGVHYFPEGF